jgi:small-conductance mechanosensitive channel
MQLGFESSILIALGLALVGSLGVWLMTRRVARWQTGGHGGPPLRWTGLAVVWLLALATVLNLRGLDAWRVVAGPAVRIVIILGATWLAYTLLAVIIDWLKALAYDEDLAHKSEREQRADTLAAVTRGAGLVMILLVAGTMILREFGVDITPIIAGAGVVGLAISFGAQTLVRDVITGVLILLENQFAVGDSVQVGSISGGVEKMTLRATYLRDLQGTLHVVPNGEIRILSNKTQSWARAVIDVDVSLRADLTRTLDVLRQVGQELASDPGLSPDLLEPPTVTGVEGLSDSAITLRLMAKVKPGQQWAMARAMRQRIKAAFDAAEIETPVPQREVLLQPLPQQHDPAG